MAQILLQQNNRAVKCEVLPDMRKRVTRRYDVVDQQAATKTTELFDTQVKAAWGTTDETYPECRLIAQDFSGQVQNENKAPNDPPPHLIRVFEEIDANARTQVGRTDISYDQYGRKTAVNEFLQFSDGTTIYTDVVGSSAAPAPNAACILKNFEAPNDGTLIRWKLTYIDSGELARDFELNFGGNLIILTITSLNEVPATPAGYTLWGPGVEFVEGLPVYKYRFSAVNGGGVPGTAAEISRSYYDSQGGVIAFDPANPTSGVGAVKAVIKYITAQTVTTNPIPLPSGFTLIGLDEEDAQGYKMWTGSYGFGSGTVDTQDETHNEGALLIRTITALGSAPATPGGYTLVSAESRNADGYVIYTYRFANGTGIVLTGTETREGGKLILYHRTEFNPGGAYTPATPSATIGGTVTLVSRDLKNEDGFYSYTSTWAEGNGEIDRNVEYFYSPNQGTTGITRTSIKYLDANSVGSNPITGPGGAELISVDRVQQDGYQIWSAVYASGTGTIRTETDFRNKGMLVIYKLTALNTAPAAPAPTIGGTVVLISTEVANGTRIEDGNVIYTYTWAEGNGTISNDTRGEPDGALVQLITTLSAAASTPTTPGIGWYLIGLDSQAESGCYINRATYKKPPVTQTFKKTTTFTKPGNAVISGSPLQLVYRGPVTMTVLADVVVDYGTSQITDAPFTVSAFATLYETWTPTATGITVQRTNALGGYLAESSGTSGTNSVYNGVLCNSWSYSLGSSTPSTFTAAVHVLHTENDPYLTATDGTVVYRRTKVSYDFS